MSLPIKYIENNMVKNKYDEWWAYYRIVPYNYSFTSPDEKIQIFNRLRQLIGQTREGNIHLLQVSTEKSVREAQERSKELVNGRLKNVACEIIDLQTEVLVDGLRLEEPEDDNDIPFYTGETQIEYQYYIGFRLISSDADSIKNYLTETAIFWKDYICGINKNLMGDYETISKGEFERYVRLERLLYSRISRLFDTQRVSTNEIGYIVEHIYGSVNTTFEDYKYYLPVDDYGEHKEVKYYDILKLSHTLVTEHPKYLGRYRTEKKRTVVAILW